VLDRRPMKRRSLAALSLGTPPPNPRLRALLFVFLLVPLGCNEAPLQQAPADGGTAVAGLSADQAARVVAKVGDRAITLGDFAKALERMDQFDRLRYQSKDRRRELLDEMIDVELLAGEAKRRGVDKDPEAADQLRALLRDAMLADARLSLPTPAQLTQQEVSAYFDAHADKFNEPERRRVAAIVMNDKKEAAKVLTEALKVKSPAEWGALFFKHSITAPKPHGGPVNPAELAGDLGIVGSMTDPRGGNPRVPDAVRAEAFKLKELYDVAPELVETEGRQFIVRINGVTPAHKRTLAESDRAIRVLLIQEKMAAQETALEEALKKKFPVEIDDAALAAVKVSIPEKAESALPPPTESVESPPKADKGK
jgi:peptidyl-prolyl cis-trans isomerase C